MTNQYYYWKGFDSGYSDHKNSLDPDPSCDAPFGLIGSKYDQYIRGYYEGWNEFNLQAFEEDSKFSCEHFNDEEDICEFTEDNFPEYFEGDDDLEGINEDDQNDFYSNQLGNEEKAYLIGVKDTLTVICNLIEGLIHG